MSNVRLTNESDYLLTLLYREYINRRKQSISKMDAKVFYNGAPEIHQTLVPNWSERDTLGTCYELANANMLVCESADDTVCFCYLTDEAIIRMENKFIDGLEGLLSYLERARNLLPF